MPLLSRTVEQIDQKKVSSEVRSTIGITQRRVRIVENLRRQLLNGVLVLSLDNLHDKDYNDEKSKIKSDLEILKELIDNGQEDKYLAFNSLYEKVQALQETFDNRHIQCKTVNVTKTKKYKSISGNLTLEVLLIKLGLERKIENFQLIKRIAVQLEPEFKYIPRDCNDKDCNISLSPIELKNEEGFPQERESALYKSFFKKINKNTEELDTPNKVNLDNDNNKFIAEIPNEQKTRKKKRSIWMNLTIDDLAKKVGLQPNEENFQLIKEAVNYLQPQHKRYIELCYKIYNDNNFTRKEIIEKSSMENYNIEAFDSKVIRILKKIIKAKKENNDNIDYNKIAAGKFRKPQQPIIWTKHSIEDLFNKLEMEFNEENKKLVFGIIEKLNVKEKTYFELFYRLHEDNNFLREEMAKQIGIVKSYIFNFGDRAVNRLKKIINDEKNSLIKREMDRVMLVQGMRAFLGRKKEDIIKKEENDFEQDKKVNNHELAMRLGLYDMEEQSYIEDIQDENLGNLKKKKNMIDFAKLIDECRDKISKLIGKEVSINIKYDHNKVKYLQGEIESVSPKFFSVKVINKNKVGQEEYYSYPTTFYYSDVLDGTVNLNV